MKGKNDVSREIKEGREKCGLGGTSGSLQHRRHRGKGQNTVLPGTTSYPAFKPSGDETCLFKDCGSTAASWFVLFFFEGEFTLSDFECSCELEDRVGLCMIHSQGCVSQRIWLW